MSEALRQRLGMVQYIRAMEFACPLCGETAFGLMTPTETMFFATVASYGQSKTNSE